MTPVLADLTLPHQIHMMHARSTWGGGHRIAVSCTCTARPGKHGGRPRYTVIAVPDLHADRPAADAIAAWRAWHTEHGIEI
jgi:hypothetical protein